MVRLVLFDIDGTMLLTNHVGITAFDRVLKSQFGVPNGTRGLNFAGRTDTGLIREIFLKHGIAVTEENRERFLVAYLHFLAEMLPHCSGVVCAGVAGLMEEMKSLPTPPTLGLLTGNFRLGAELKLRQFGLWDDFVLGAFAEDHEDRNLIAAAALERGRAMLGPDLKGEEIVVIGDTPHDITCGRAIGAKVLAVATGNFSVKELAALKPDWTLPDLTHLGAAEICEMD